MATNSIRVKRVYEEPDRSDGARVLVDRIWPRGVTKEDAALDQWCTAVAPSAGLRKWYGHDPGRFGEFERRYRDELANDAAVRALDELRQLARRAPLTLITATTDTDISAAEVLVRVLRA